MEDTEYTILESEIAAGYDRMKQNHGTVAMTVFIISGIYHHVAFGGIRSLVGIRSIVFFVVGMFAAPLTLGVGMYLLQRLLGKLPFDPFKTRTVIILQILAIGLFGFQIVVPWLVTRWVYLWLYSPGS